MTDREADGDPDGLQPADIAAALVAWAVPYSSLEELRAAVTARRRGTGGALPRRRGADPRHGPRDEGTRVRSRRRHRPGCRALPSRRSVTESDDPARALEEERRLAYVAWTRARRSLTLVYDPLSPSEFMLEAFDADELGIDVAP